MAESGISPFSRTKQTRERKSIRLSSRHLVEASALFSDKPLPLLMRPAMAGVSLLEWAKANQEFIEEQLLQYGAILFRDFGVSTAESFEAFAEATSSGGLLEYSYCSTPRRPVSGGIYTSTEYPSDQSIPMHNEMSYARNWPMKIWFFCIKAAREGGATPIADSSRVFERINPLLREKFARHGVMYVRNYRDNLDLSSRQVFGTSDRAEIEQFCQEARIEAEFGPNHELRTRQTCQAIALHPKKHNTVWFNQAHLFHVSSLDTGVAASLLAEFGEAGLPRTAYYGDGSAIEEVYLKEIREAYRDETVTFAWNEGDILMLDNMQVAHSRQPFSGERKVVVAMAEPSGCTMI